MSLPIVESLSGLQESIFSLFRGLQLNSRKNKKKTRILLNYPITPISPRWATGCLGSLGLLLFVKKLVQELLSILLVAEVLLLSSFTLAQAQS